MSETIKGALNRADLNVLADMLRTVGLGDLIRALTTTIRKSGTVASPYAPAATLVVTKQAADASALAVIRAYARAGAGAPGELAVQAVGVVPAAGQIGVDFAGQIVTAAADAWTDLDVVYDVDKGDLHTFTGAVDPATGIMTLPAGAIGGGAVLLAKADAVGGVPGPKKIVAPGAVPAAGNANLSAAKSQVQFAVADAVTSATISLLTVAAIDVNALLSADSTFI